MTDYYTCPECFGYRLSCGCDDKKKEREVTDDDKALVGRLRMAAKEDDEYWARERWAEAADRIEALSAEVERLRGIASDLLELLPDQTWPAILKARAALGETE